MPQDAAAKLVAATAGVGFASFGVWAFVWPRSFFERIATFEPYNVHLLHDLGAFQIAIAVALLAALVWRDALLVVLLAAAVGTAVHLLSHAIDRDLGGRSTDLWALGGLAVLLGAAAVLRGRALSRSA